ncbi:hypothetical protein [Rurimicrobium arvi]
MTEYWDLLIALLRKPSVIAFMTVVISAVTFIVTWRYRRKDLYNQLLKEQIAAGYSIVNDMTKLNNLFNEGYKEVVGQELSKHLMSGKPLEAFEYEFLQTSLLVKLQPEYMTLYGQISSKAFIFPESIQEYIVAPLKKISDLFENDNDENLGLELMKLWDNTADLVDALNHYFKIDKLSKQLKRHL